MSEQVTLPDFNALSDSAFRETVREFLHAHFPDELRDLPKRLHWEEVKDWYMTLSAHGWLCPGWPREFGGMGLSAAKQLIYTEEFEN
ncbi:acyl-CoA dehydrogenase family protein, partial [Pseudomonas putida]|nr:acyl-CoA dehydrogenase family protein [Pseudomonas putida]